MSIVIDASVTLSWYFEDEATAAADEVLDRVVRAGAIVPPLWRLEVANAFQTGIRRKRVDPKFRDQSLADLAQMPIALDGDTDAYVWTATLGLSDRHGLTLYEACYLELAQRLNLPLATRGEQLRTAGRALGLTLLGA